MTDTRMPDFALRDAVLLAKSEQIKTPQRLRERLIAQGYTEEVARQAITDLIEIFEDMKND